MYDCCRQNLHQTNNLLEYFEQKIDQDILQQFGKLKNNGPEWNGEVK